MKGSGFNAIIAPEMREDFQNILLSEFDAPRWAVINFEKCVASGLDYEQAAKLVQEMSGSASGLCIVTDEAAHRILASNGKRHSPDEHSEDGTKHFTETL